MYVNDVIIIADENNILERVWMPYTNKGTIESICWIAHHIPHIPHLFLETRRLRLLVFGSQDE